MITFLDIYVDEMLKNGLTFQDANNLFNEFAEHPANAAMKGRWLDNVKEYFPQMVGITRLAVRAFLEEKGYIN